MLQIGRYNELKVSRKTEIGVYLQARDEEILLPRKYVPEGTQEGDVLNVFVYTDSEDRPIATTLKPHACVGEFAYMRVKEVSRVGAFLDWGLEKDLLVPFSEQEQKMEEGKGYVVAVYLDFNTDRVAASAKLHKFIEYEDIEVQEGDIVELLVVGQTGMGYNAIINNRHMGLIYHNEVFQPLMAGDRVRGFVKLIREDKKIDLSLQRSGGELIEDARGKVLGALKKNEGFLPLTDNSSPEEIQRVLQMSKKAFKKAVGGLYKDRMIEITDDGIKLN
jgi:predicted RNA-binding protein (virulence factor B family)